MYVCVQSLGGGVGAWNDGKDKPDSGGPNTWNVDILVQVIKDLVRAVISLALIALYI